MFENAGFAGDARSVADVILMAYKQRQLMGLAESLHAKAREAARPEEVDAVVELVDEGQAIEVCRVDVGFLGAGVRFHAASSSVAGVGPFTAPNSSLIACWISVMLAEMSVVAAVC